MVALSPDETELRFTVVLGASNNQQIPLDLGVPELFDLYLDQSLPLTTSLSGTLRFAADLAASQPEFFIADDAANPEFNLTGAVSKSDIASAGRVGFICRQPG